MKRSLIKLCLVLLPLAFTYVGAAPVQPRHVHTKISEKSKAVNEFIKAAMLDVAYKNFYRDALRQQSESSPWTIQQTGAAIGLAIFIIMLALYAHRIWLDKEYSFLINEVCYRIETAGKIAYMAPEDRPGITSREAVIYMLCAGIYERLAGVPPFTEPESYKQKIEGHFRPLSQIVPGLSTNVDRVMNKALNPKRELRYHTIHAFFSDLGIALAQNPTEKIISWLICLENIIFSRLEGHYSPGKRPLVSQTR